MKYKPDPIEEIRNLKPGESHRAVKITPIFNPDGIRGHLRAIDPLTGRSKWATPFKSPNWAGTLVTEGGLVSPAQLTGEFIAVDSEPGKVVWQFQPRSGIIGQPVTWEHNGKQYVTVTSGTGGVYVLKTPDPNLTHVPRAGRFGRSHCSISNIDSMRPLARAPACSRVSVCPAQSAFWPPV